MKNKQCFNPYTKRLKFSLFMSLLLLMGNYYYSLAQCTTLVWRDEFEGTTLDRTKWNYAVGRGCDTPAGCGFGNGEEQAYTNSSKNVFISNGILTIKTIAESVEPGAAFSSGKIQTLGLHYFQYGKIEARMKLPSAQGAWPAFWMLAKNNSWPFTGEIDIMEAKHKNPTQTMGTVWHYNGHTSGERSGLPDLSQAFHTYAIEWEKDEIRWYFDGILFHRATPKTTGGAWPFNDSGNPFFLILNTAVGGLGTPFTGNQVANAADFPTTFEIDYVRVYSGTWNVEFAGDQNVYKGETGKVYSVSSVTGATGYNWSVPSGATITSGQGTNRITVNFGSAASSGNINVSITSGCASNTYSKPILVEDPFTVTTVLKDFDGVTNMTFKSASGTLTEVANPSGSGRVGKYVRNGGQLYDNLLHNNIAFGNASDFVTKRRRIQMDVNTSAPIGTLIRIQLENAGKSSQTFPVGRHSVYEVRTTKQNAWETVEFEYVNSPDLGTGGTTVDQMALLFAVESNTSHTYHIDNIQIGTAGTLCPRTPSQTLEDFQTNRNITYSSSTGTYTAGVANPSASGENTSAQVGRYVRNSGELYDVLFYKNVAINNVANFKNGKSAFKLQVYSSAPVGTVISLQLETSASTPQNYPTGRHSLYQVTTTKQNQWETLEFSFVSSLDALAADAAVNSMVLLFAPNSNNSSTYYIDNLITEAENCGGNVAVTGVSVSPTTTSVAAGSTQQLTATILPANATNKSVVWSSNNTAVATVSSTGLVTGVAEGTATITVTTNDGGKTASSNVTVTPGGISVTGVTVSPTTASLPIGGTQQLIATVSPSNASNKNVSWSSSNTAIATVSSTGLVTARGAGNAVITVTTQQGARTATSTITVTGTPSENLALNKPTTASSIESSTYSGSAAVDGSTSTRWSSQFTDAQYIYVDLGATYNVNRVKINWEAAFGKDYTVDISANATSWTPIRTVTNNTTLINDWTGLTGSGRYIRINGTARGTAYGYSIFELEVYGTSGPSDVAVTGVTVSPTSASIVAGATRQLTAAISPTNATNKNVTWSSSNTAVATVSTSGLVSAVAVGNATITVKTVDGSKTATSAITVTSTPITGATVYEHCNYGGIAVTLPVGTYTTAQLASRGVNNNWISSVKVPSGYTITLYDLDNFTGTSVSHTADYSCLVNNSFNDKATSIRVTQGTTGGACSGTATNGDYSYQVATVGSNVNFTFLPLSPISGSNMAILYVRAGSTGAYAGYIMNASGSNFTASVASTNGQVLSFYFTYRVGLNGPERTSLSSPHSYTVGTTCSTSRLVDNGGLAETKQSFYPNPVQGKVVFEGLEEGAKIIIRNVNGANVLETKINNNSVDLSQLQKGVYVMQINNGKIVVTKHFIKE